MSGLKLLCTTAMNNVPKCTEARNMNTIVMTLMALESNDAMERFFVLKPPVAHTLKA